MDKCSRFGPAWAAFDSFDINDPSFREGKKKKTREEEKEKNKGETKVRPRGEIRLQDPRKNSGKNNKGPITADKLAKRRGYN